MRVDTVILGVVHQRSDLVENLGFDQAVMPSVATGTKIPLDDLAARKHCFHMDCAENDIGDVIKVVRMPVRRIARLRELIGADEDVAEDVLSHVLLTFNVMVRRWIVAAELTLKASTSPLVIVFVQPDSALSKYFVAAAIVGCEVPVILSAAVG